MPSQVHLFVKGARPSDCSGLGFQYQWTENWRSSVLVWTAELLVGGLCKRIYKAANYCKVLNPLFVTLQPQQLMWTGLRHDQLSSGAIVKSFHLVQIASSTSDRGSSKYHSGLEIASLSPLNISTSEPLHWKINHDQLTI